MHINGQHIYEILAKPEKQLLPFKVNALLMPPTNVFEMLTGKAVFVAKVKHGEDISECVYMDKLPLIINALKTLST